MSKIVLNPNTDLRLPFDDLNNNNSQTNMFGDSNTKYQHSNVFQESNFAPNNFSQQNLGKEVPNYDFLNNYNQVHEAHNYLGNVSNLESNSAFDNFIFVIVVIFFVISIFLFVYFVLRYFNVSLF